MKYFILIAILVYSCSNSINNKYIPSRYEEISDEILKQMEKKLSKKYHMQVISDRAGLAGQVNLLGLGFQIYGPLSQEQLRVILVDCVEEFLSTINNNEEIRLYLKMYPFTAEGIQIDIFVVDSKGRRLFDPDIELAIAKNGALIYKKTDKEAPLKYKSIVTESYKDALKLTSGG